MAKRCEVCGKGPVVGRTVSHAHNVGPRRFEPNLQSVRVTTPGGSNKTIRVCTQCIRSGAITKRVRNAPFKLPAGAAKAAS